MGGENSLFGVFFSLLRRDLTLAARYPSQWINPLLFFMIAVSLFPLGIGPESGILREIAAGTIWVSALLASMLAQDGLFRADFEDGSLEQMLTSSQSLTMMVSAKIIAHWLVTGLPLIILSPVLAIFMQLSGNGLKILLVTLVLGTPILSLLGAMGAALVVSVKRGGILLSLLVLPLCVPTLIFATAAVQSAAVGLAVEGQLSLLGALLALAATVIPLTVGATLRMTGGGET